MAKCPACKRFVESVGMQYLRCSTCEREDLPRKAGGWSPLFVRTATRFWVPFASRQLLRLTSEAEQHVPESCDIQITKDGTYVQEQT